MMNGGVPPRSATPTPEEEKNPEYLKELQAEKDSLESSYAAIMASATSEITAENNSDPDSVSKTNHAIKLLEQGKTGIICQFQKLNIIVEHFRYLI